MSAACCPRCLGPVELHQGLPQITGDGSVVLWCAACWAVRDQAIVAAAPAPVAPPPSRRPGPAIALAGAVAASALLAMAVAHLAAPPSPSSEPPPVAPRLDAPVGAPTTDPAVAVAREPLPTDPGHVATLFEASYPVPVVDGVALDARFPTLRIWTHPVTRSAELVPEMRARGFGAERHGVMRTECGAGHCGIDLDGPRGRPLVAVADGIVVRVELHELGLDGRSGRYVRIEHDDGTLTSYMHLDDVAPLQPGDRILAGQYLGTLGASGVYDAVAHLHFSLEVPNHPGHGPHGDTTDTHYVDPAPYLVRATIVDVADRRRGRRPAL